MAISLPGIYESISNGNLQLVTGLPEDVVLNIGVSAGGTVNVASAYGSPMAAKSALVGGSGLSYVSNEFSYTGGPVLFMPINASINGGVGDGVYSGQQQGTISVGFGPIVPFTIKVITGGANGTYSVSLDGGNYGATQNIPQNSDGYKASVLGTFTKVTFSDGGASFVSLDTYSVATSGVITHAGSGGGTVTQSSQVVDNYTVDVNIDAYGTTSTSPRPQFSYSLDGVSFVSGINLSSSNVYGISGSGLVLTFSGTFNALDGYSFQTCGPSYSQADQTAALNAIPNTLQFSLTHFVRGAALSNAVAAESEAVLVGSALSAKFAAGLGYSSAIHTVPTLGSVSASAGSVVIDTTDTDGYLVSSYSSFASDYVDKVAGDCVLLDQLTGLQLRRPWAWVEAATAASVSASTMTSATSLGSRPNVVSLFRDENNTPNLDAAHFTTARTFNNAAGFYITSSYLSGAPGSDYQFLVFGRVVGLMAYFARLWAFPFINEKQPTNQNPNAIKGSIDPLRGATLDSNGTSFMSRNMVPSNLVSVSLQVDKNHSLTDGKLPVVVNGGVYLYSRFITISLALVLQA